MSLKNVASRLCLQSEKAELSSAFLLSYLFLESDSIAGCLALAASDSIKYLAHKDCSWKYQGLVDAMRAINTEDECNDTYGRILKEIFENNTGVR